MWLEIYYYNMSKYCVISDIHGNYPALKSVINDTENIDKYICTGDILGIMGYPSKTVDTIKQISDYTIVGNHDISLIHYNQGLVSDDDISKYELELTYDNLNGEQVKWLSNLDSYMEKDGFIISHAQPFKSKSSGLENDGIYKRDYIELAGSLSSDTLKNINFILLGHTHQQASLDCTKFGYEDLIILNSGSVGQPTQYPTADHSESDLNIADYSIIDTDNITYEQKSVEYDFNKVINKLKNDNIYKIFNKYYNIDDDY